MRAAPITDEAYNHTNKIMIHGDSNSGKTHLLATIGGRGLIIDQEKGLKTLQNIEGKTLRKNVAKIDGIQTTNPEEILNAISYIKGNPKKYDWIALDSISDTAYRQLEECCVQAGDNRMCYLKVEHEMNQILRALRDLTNYRVIVIAGTKRLEDEDTKRTTYRPSMPSANMSRSLEYWFDVVLCAHCKRTAEGQEVKTQHYLQCQATPTVFAKDRTNQLALYEKADLKHIYKTIGE